MPIPQDHTIVIQPNVPRNQTGESPYKFMASCSCGYQALGFNVDMARYYGKQHMGLKMHLGHNVTFKDYVEPVAAAEKR
jgi:hypothetical protein